jgi:hypothetical protein
MIFCTKLLDNDIHYEYFIKKEEKELENLESIDVVAPDDASETSESCRVGVKRKIRTVKRSLTRDFRFQSPRV